MPDVIRPQPPRGLHIYTRGEEDAYSGEHALIPGAVGLLEALTEYPQHYQDSTPIAVVCHPHPLHGGSMANKVVHILSDTFVEMGLPTLRFNFRGVGKSEGRFDAGIGEGSDLMAAIQWFRARHPQSALWLAGFSFGAYVAARMHREAGAERLLLVAPPVTLFDFKTCHNVDIPWMVVQGGKDKIIDPLAVANWVQHQPAAPVFRWLPEADHFFHGRLNRLRDIVKAQWTRQETPAED